MNIFDALILGILQGITEFLPISSSGHLVLAESFMSLPVKDLLAFDIAVHFGTLLSIFVYFRRDFAGLISSFFKIAGDALFKRSRKVEKSVSSDGKTCEDGELILGIIIATLPAVIAGLLFADVLEESLRSKQAVAAMMILTALYFVIAEKAGYKRKMKKFGIKQMLIIGVGQAFALAPGISRSGTTIATGVIQGMERREAARFSFLLGSVAITAATALALLKIFKGEFMLPGMDVLVTGIAVSFVFGLAAIAVLMRFLKKHSLAWFSLYLALAGGILLIFP